MRISKTVFRLSALLIGLFAATETFADAESSFYEKEHIRGFISVGGDYRNMNSEHIKYINRLLFAGGKGFVVKDAASGDSTKASFVGDKALSSYDHFDDYYLGLHVNIGAQYKQFLTWFDVNFMPTQVSEGDGATDASWFAYGADWMFGWKLFGENTIINLIPAVGIGFNLLNLHFINSYDILSYDGGAIEDQITVTDMRNRYYSTFAMTFNTELELRFSIDPISIGAYAGYRFIRYNEIEVEDVEYGSSDVNGDTFFIGARVTWTFLSPWQKKQRDRL
ncbi:MAG: hypothetical protein UH678_08905 [Fibrobacteraceae bacterium]|jgi:hypothetical protein|nr:hypothetical protein [Fibrobacteraceae bacterium]